MSTRRLSALAEAQQATAEAFESAAVAVEKVAALVNPQYERAPSRQGKRMVAAFVDEGVWLQLRIAGLDERTSVQTIMCEALDDWFRKKGLPPIAGAST
jgi:hypothetical protein